MSPSPPDAMWRPPGHHPHETYPLNTALRPASPIRPHRHRRPTLLGQILRPHRHTIALMDDPRPANTLILININHPRDTTRPTTHRNNPVTLTHQLTPAAPSPSQRNARPRAHRPSPACNYTPNTPANTADTDPAPPPAASASDEQSNHNTDR